jgi:phosphoglucosamine mutase
LGKLFGTDGIRGIANKDLTVDLAFRLGRALSYLLMKEKEKNQVVIGMDTRVSSDMLEAAMIAGLCSSGTDVLSLGVIPTPGVAYLTRAYEADAGIVISASHNPHEFNGIKIFNNKGYKLSDELEAQIESMLLNDAFEYHVAKPNAIGKRTIMDTAMEDYESFLQKTVKVRLDGMKIAIDCANGAASTIAPSLLYDLGAEVFVLHNEPDGVNINQNCGSTHMKELCAYVKERGADIGLAFDGDADRVLAVDENGNVVDGDQIMTIIGLHLKNQGKLKNNTIVATVMSNLGLDIMGRENDIQIMKTKVGDRYVLEEMIKDGYVLGGEQSGHIIFLEHNTTGDGMLTGLFLLQVLKEQNKALSHLTSAITILPQVLKNAKVRNENKYKYMEDALIADLCQQLESEFHGNGRVLIRPSGTEPLVRVMIEGKDLDYITDRAHVLARAIEERLG